MATGNKFTQLQAFQAGPLIISALAGTSPKIRNIEGAKYEKPTAQSCIRTHTHIYMYECMCVRLCVRAKP